MLNADINPSSNLDLLEQQAKIFTLLSQHAPQHIATFSRYLQVLRQASPQYNRPKSREAGKQAAQRGEDCAQAYLHWQSTDCAAWLPQLLEEQQQLYESLLELRPLHDCLPRFTRLYRQHSGSFWQDFRQGYEQHKPVIFTRKDMIRTALLISNDFYYQILEYTKAHCPNYEARQEHFMQTLVQTHDLMEASGYLDEWMTYQGLLHDLIEFRLWNCFVQGLLDAVKQAYQLPLGDGAAWPQNTDSLPPTAWVQEKQAAMQEIKSKMQLGKKQKQAMAQYTASLQQRDALVLPLAYTYGYEGGCLLLEFFLPGYQEDLHYRSLLYAALQQHLHK